MSTLKTNTRSLTYMWEFIKLQIAGSVLFFGTILGFYVGENLLHAPLLPTLVVSSALAHVAFFMINRAWVFSGMQSRSGRSTIVRFSIFMGVNFFLNILLVELIAQALRSSSSTLLTSSLLSAWAFTTEWLATITGGLMTNWQHYIAQILTGLLSSIWTFIGLRFWVFKSSKQHANASLSRAMTHQTKLKRHAK